MLLKGSGLLSDDDGAAGCEPKKGEKVKPPTALDQLFGKSVRKTAKRPPVGAAPAVGGSKRAMDEVDEYDHLEQVIFL